MAEVRVVLVPQNRRAPLKESWKSIVEILTKQLKLMVCMKTAKKSWKVMLRNSPETTDPQFLQKGVDFVSAFVKGQVCERKKATLMSSSLSELIDEANWQRLEQLVFSTYL
nr:unnamed protein product [Spirometra erinaceieuropaei]